MASKRKVVKPTPSLIIDMREVSEWLKTQGIKGDLCEYLDAAKGDYPYSNGECVSICWIAEDDTPQWVIDALNLIEESYPSELDILLQRNW
jgi:hypothetical protein